MSSSPWVALSLAACIGGASGGLVVWWVTKATPTDRALAEPRGGQNGGAGRGAASEESVEDRIADLEQQLLSLRRRQAASQALAAFSQAAVGQTDSGTAGAGATMPPMIDEDDPTFELAVRGVMDRIQSEQQQAREAERILRTQDRAERLTELMTEELGLRDDQRQAVAKALAGQFQRMRELRRPDADAGVNRPVTRGEWRERMDSIREETDKHLAEVLNASQLQQFQQIRDEEGFMPGFGRRGGDPRGGRTAPSAPPEPR